MVQLVAIEEALDPARPLRAGRLAMLSRLGRDDEEILASSLPRTPLERRLQLAERLVSLGEDDVTLDFETVFDVMLEDADPAVRKLAIEGLWETEDRRFIDRFLALLKNDADPTVRAAAALALGRFVLLGVFDTLRPRDVERAASGLRRVAQDSALSPELRRRAIEAVGASAEPWVRDLIWSAYDAEERLLQIGAIHAMGRNGDADWLATLYVEMESDDPERRYEAAIAAGQIGDEDAIPYLSDLIDDPDPEVQAAAAGALGEIGGEVAIETLRDHVRGASTRLAEALRAAIVAAAAEISMTGGSDLDALEADDEESDDDEA